MFCRNCGASNPDDAAKCAQCGADLAVPPQSTSPETPPPSAPFAPSTPPAPMPPNWLWLGIVSTLFCCLPAGIVSIVFAAQVNTKYTTGDYSGALDSSNKAKMWGLIAVVAGLIVMALYVVIAVLAAVGTHSAGSGFPR